MRTFLITASALTLLATSAFAADFAAPSTDLTKIQSGKYQLDKSHASITYTISHLGYSHYTSRFNDFDATLDFDAKDPTKSKLEVKINPASTDSNNAHLKEKLDSATFFDTVKFPEAKFVSTKIEKTSATEGLITGDLTLHGVTKPVVLKTTFNGGGVNPFAGVDSLGFSAIGKLNRSDFGITEYLPAVGDEVKFYVEVEFNLPKEAK